MTRLILKIRDSLRRLLQILETLFELSKRKEFAFAGFNFGEASGEDFFVPAGRFQFVRLGGHESGGCAGTDRHALKPVRFAAYPCIHVFIIGRWQ